MIRLDESKLANEKEKIGTKNLKSLWVIYIVAE